MTALQNKRVEGKNASTIKADQKSGFLCKKPHMSGKSIRPFAKSKIRAC